MSKSSTTSNTRGAKFKVNSWAQLRILLPGKDVSGMAKAIAEAAHHIEEYYENNHKAASVYARRAKTNIETIVKDFRDEDHLSQKAVVSIIHAVFYHSDNTQQINDRIKVIENNLVLHIGESKHVTQIQEVILDDIEWKKKQAYFSCSQGWVLSFEPQRYEGVNLLPPNGIIHFTQEYWDTVRMRMPTSDVLLEYYTNIDCSLRVLPFIVSAGLHVFREEVLEDEDGEILELASFISDSTIEKEPSIIRLHAQAGSGKSTFFFQLAQSFYKKNQILYLPRANVKISLAKSDQHGLIFVDDYSLWDSDVLLELLFDLQQAFASTGFVLILADQNIRTHSIQAHELTQTISTYIGRPYVCTLTSSDEFNTALFNTIEKHIDIPPELKEYARRAFYSGVNRTSTDRICQLLFGLKRLNRQFAFEFDWHHWKSYCRKNVVDPGFEALYELVACLNHFGIHPKIELCRAVLGISLTSARITGILHGKNLPVMLDLEGEEALVVRNVNLIPVFLEHEDPNYVQCASNLKECLSNALHKPMLESSVHFIRNFWRNKRIINLKHTSQLIPQDKAFIISTFSNYVAQTKSPVEVAKTQMELHILYAERGDDKLAIESLEYVIRNHPSQSTHARTKLAQHYISTKKWEDAFQILDTLIKREPTNIRIIRPFIKTCAILKPNSHLIERCMGLFKAQIQEGNKAYILTQIRPYLKDEDYAHLFFGMLPNPESVFTAPKGIKLQYLALLRLEIITSSHQIYSKLLEHISSRYHSSRAITSMASDLRNLGDIQGAYSLLKKHIGNIGERAQPALFLHLCVTIRLLLKNYILPFNVARSRFDEGIHLCDEYSTSGEPILWNISKYELCTTMKYVLIHHKQPPDEKTQQIKEVSKTALYALKSAFNTDHSHELVIRTILRELKKTRRYFLMLQYADMFCSAHQLEPSLYWAKMQAFRYMDSNEAFKWKNRFYTFRREYPNSFSDQYDFENEIENTLISYGNAGMFDGQSVTSITSERSFPLALEPNISNYVYLNTLPCKVFYSVNRVNSQEVANNIEPYFDRLKNNKSRLSKTIWG